jgi:hypothetical protein
VVHGTYHGKKNGAGWLKQFINIALKASDANADYRPRLSS